MDIFIFWLTLKYGASQVRIASFARHFRPLVFLTLDAFLILYFYFIREVHDTLIGSNSAYVAQFFICVLCLQVLLASPTLVGMSFNMAWLRSFGTGANTIFIFLHYHGQPFCAGNGRTGLRTRYGVPGHLPGASGSRSGLKSGSRSIRT